MSFTHGFPFRFVDRVEGRRATVGCTADGWWSRAGTGLPPSLWTEVAAQAAAALLPAAERPGVGPEYRLTGIERSRVMRMPEAGDRIEIEVELAGSFGTAARLVARLRLDGEEVATAVLTLSRA